MIRVYNAPVFDDLDREMHSAYVQMRTEAGTSPSEGVWNIWEHRQFPWRVMARRQYEAAQARVPLRLYLTPLWTLERWARLIHVQAITQSLNKRSA